MIKASVPGKYSRDQQRSPGPLSTSLCPCTQGNDQRNKIIPNKDCGFPYPVKNMAFFRKISALSYGSSWGVSPAGPGFPVQSFPSGKGFPL